MDIGYSFGQMIWIVLVYSFLGWCCEVAFAAVRRGARTACRRSACRTRLRPEGFRAPCHFRGVLAKRIDSVVRVVLMARGRPSAGAGVDASRGLPNRPLGGIAPGLASDAPAT